MKINIIILLPLILLFNLSVIIAANNTPIEEIPATLVISDAWARATLSPNKNSAVYMNITNPTDKEFILIGASAMNVANNVELHKSYVDDKGVSRMTSLDKIVIPAGSEIKLNEGGMHIMLFDLKNNLKAGQKINIALKFEGKEPITIEAVVK